MSDAKVNRYDLKEVGSVYNTWLEMKLAPDGDWVQASDYDNLADRVRELEEAAETAGFAAGERIEKLEADRDRLAAELAEVKAERDIFREERSAAWAQLEAWKRGELQTAEHALRDLRMEEELSAARAALADATAWLQRYDEWLDAPHSQGGVNLDWTPRNQPVDADECLQRIRAASSAGREGGASHE